MLGRAPRQGDLGPGKSGQAVLRELETFGVSGVRPVIVCMCIFFGSVAVSLKLESSENQIIIKSDVPPQKADLLVKMRT